MYKILFVCHGNICRSPMAEFIFNDLVKKRGISGVLAESAATSTEEIGNGVHYGTAAILRKLGIDCSKKRARQITRADFEKFDLIVGMDTANIRNLNRMLKNDPDGKVYKFLSFTGSGRDIADPWYTGDFEATYRDVVEGCNGFLAYLRREGKI